MFLVSFQIENIVRPFILSDDDYLKIMDVMLDSFNKGLGKETNPSARVKMFQTYVKNVPDGTGMRLLIRRNKECLNNLG